MGGATRTLALLNQQAEELRLELARLRRDLAELERGFSGVPGTQLQQVNEQLVLAALRAETIAETAVSNLRELARSGQRDALTDTPNRALMLDRLGTAIAMARRHATRIAVLFLDLDQFKPINDTFGHAVGDEVLQLVARRLESVVRDADTVSRHSGDEFVVLLTEISQASDAGLIAAKMVSKLAEPCVVSGHPLRLSASLGIAIYPEDGEEALTLINRADAAMYHSKRRGSGSFSFHNDAIPSAHGLAPSPSALQQEPVTQGEFASAQYAPHLRNLLEANEKLVVAAMAAQDLEAHADAAHRRQITFLATVAHELRNPLTPILQAAEMLHLPRTDDPRLARLQGVIKRQVAHMARLIDDLLDGSRISTGKFRLQRSTVELADILGMAIETSRPAMDKRGQQLSMEPLPAPLCVHGDPVRLAQVFSNLLDNASKYTQKGGHIRLAATLGDRSVTITVADDGIGIPAEALSHIFDLFVQDERAVAAHGGGLGIGLAVVRELVEAHGGTVVGRSAGTDRGSEFLVTLPLSDKPAAALAV